jgi:hypothetical protein
MIRVASSTISMPSVDETAESQSGSPAPQEPHLSHIKTEFKEIDICSVSAVIRHISAFVRESNIGETERGVKKGLLAMAAFTLSDLPDSRARQRLITAMWESEAEVMVSDFGNSE